MIMVGISNNPIPKGINIIITPNPMTAPMIANKTFNSTTPTLIETAIHIKNTTNPNNISISTSPIYLKLFIYSYYTIIHIKSS